MRAINGLTEKPFLSSLQKEVSTFDYRETLQKLDAIYEERRGAYRFTLSMMGAKMQAVGTALFCYMHPEIKIVFVTPQRYNAAQYSAGCKGLWNLNLGDTQALRQALDSVGQLRVEYHDPMLP